MVLDRASYPLDSEIVMTFKDFRQILEVDCIENLKCREALDTSTVVVEFSEESGRLLTTLTTSQFPIITFIEKEPNTSAFSSTDTANGSRSSFKNIGKTC